jgi:hypothetical protein
VLRVEVASRPRLLHRPAREAGVQSGLSRRRRGPRALPGYKVAGWFDLRADTGGLLLAKGDYEPDLRSFENYVRAAVAWKASALGGALVHAASAVRNGRAYLFYGESGAGKSTLAASTRRATIVSDDLSLVLPGEHGLVLVGSPFRGTYEGGDPVQGAFPLAAGFRLVQSDSVEVRTVPRLRALSELVGNLPFVAEAFAKRADLFAQVETAFAPTPARAPALQEGRLLLGRDRPGAPVTERCL